MRKTPSYLKGLAETRARAAADVLRYKQILDEVTASLARAQAELASCDTLIRKFDARLDPQQIDPVAGWQGRYGKRGALREAVLALLREYAPNPVSTSEVGLKMQLKFNIAFDHPRERKQWMSNSVAGCLKILAKDGLVEQCPEMSGASNVGYWLVVPHSRPSPWQETRLLPKTLPGAAKLGAAPAPRSVLVTGCW